VIAAGPAEPSGAVVRLRIERNPLAMMPYRTAAYWVDGLLIDTGPAHTARDMAAILAKRRVDCIVNTHSHEDHVGGNAALQASHGCPVLAHPAALPLLANPRLERLQAYRLLYWGRPRPSQGMPVGDWVETERHRFRVIETPGHSPDHVCLFEPELGWLFSGDAFIGGEDRVLREGYDVVGIIASLKRLAGLPVQTIFSGSGTVRAEGTAPLVAKVAYLEALGERIRALRTEGLTPRQIRWRLWGSEAIVTYVTLGHLSGLHLIQSYLAKDRDEK
jgi:glyoxylase-like metal-dependent hydrolase (beta-lactamase superfamily II)